jgi:hypothetical protein
MEGSIEVPLTITMSIMKQRTKSPAMIPAMSILNATFFDFDVILSLLF